MAKVVAGGVRGVEVVTGSGTNEPFGIEIRNVAAEIDTAGEALTATTSNALIEALAPRFCANALV